MDPVCGKPVDGAMCVLAREHLGECTPVPIQYEPPKVERVGNLKDMLLGEGGSVDDADVTAQDRRAGPGGA